MYGASLKAKLSLAAIVLCLLPLSTTVADAQTVVATIPIPFASDVTLNPATGLGYVPANSGVDVISEKTNTVVGFIPINSARGVEEAAVDPLTNRLYVTTSQALYVVNTTTNQVVATVNVPAAGVAVNIATDKIYVSDFDSNVYVVDGRTNNILKDISLPTGVENLVVNPVTNRIYVAEDLFPGKVAVIDGATDQVITTVNAGGDLTFNVGVDVLHNLVYTADQLGTVSVINGATNTLTATVTVGGQPADVSIDPQHRRVYVDNAGLNAVQVINGATNTVIDTVPVGASPDYSDIDIFRGLLYVVNSSDGTVSAIKTR
jgi:YVTN family beta-propeller protein